MNKDVLVLNCDYEPLNVCSMRRALVLIYLGKAEILHSEGSFTSLHLNMPEEMPSVVRLRHQIRRPLPELKLSRRTVLARDNYRCQYCGASQKEMTIDHVIPRRLGGQASWENLVCCCRRCNMKKSDKLAHQLNMKLSRLPRRPRYTPYISLPKFLSGRANSVWRDYLPVFSDIAEDARA